jgi:methionyl-tRNA synthetase
MSEETPAATPAPQEPSPAAGATAPAAPPTAEAGKPVINYDDFAKLDLRVGKVIEIKNHPNADKLYVASVDLGGGQVRQVIAGLRPYIAPEGLIGRNVIVVANLEPRKMRGLESQGMLLAASYMEGPDRKVVILTTDLPVPPGSTIS